jgi:hypothetical protein
MYNNQSVCADNEYHNYENNLNTCVSYGIEEIETFIITKQ